jgi:hypothetical protein
MNKAILISVGVVAGVLLNRSAGRLSARERAKDLERGGAEHEEDVAAKTEQVRAHVDQLVDESLEESFPASDPPSFSPGT